MAPQDSEVDALGTFGTPALQEAVSDATEPTDAELERLLARRPWTAPVRTSRPLVLGGLGMAAAASALALVIATSTPQGTVQPVGYGPVAMEFHMERVLGTQIVELGPSIAMSGEASVVLDQAGEAGTALTLLEGRAHFDVDPNGEWRDLAVDADGVLVQVHGTVFDVIRKGGDIRVEVERGRVSVAWDGQEIFVTTGQSWKRPDVEVVSVWTPPSIEEVAIDQPVVQPQPIARVQRAEPEGIADDAVVQAAPTEMEQAVEAGLDEGIAAEEEPVFRIREGSADHELAQVLALQASGIGSADLLAETDQVLGRHRGSGVGTELELVRLQTLARVDPSLAALEMADWLDANPGASRAPLVRFERAHVTHRSLGRCASALGDYRALADRTDDIGARAAAGAGLCAAELGHDSIAERYFADALERGITGTLQTEVQAARASLRD
ncbi:MAG: hypothetical protein ACJATT_000239 [Myxococcota bacterium]|jgi:hypothetical protein